MLRLGPIVLTASIVIVSIVALGSVAWQGGRDVGAVAAVEIQVSNDQFARYVDEWSEPEGYFDSDNFISNETSYLHVVNQLKQKVPPGGVYVGVGPDQNFSYIVHTRPTLAIIIDIRRQNMLEHLFFKALFELSSSRAEFLARLFARPTPALARDIGLRDLTYAIRRLPFSHEVYEANLVAIRDLLLNKHKLSLSSSDFAKIEYLYRAFSSEGLDLRFSTIGRGNALNYPTYESLMLETDEIGQEQNYLVSDDLFQWMKRFQTENRLIPAVGDFSGSHAFKTVGAFLKTQSLQVSTFYTSNVEFYLFGRPAWPAYMENVRALPASSDAVFIRAYFSTYGRRHPMNVPGHRPTTLVHGFRSFLEDYTGGQIRTYWDVVNR